MKWIELILIINVFAKKSSPFENLRFIMPSKYWTSLEDAPLPAENSGVSLEERPTETLAVSIFGGYALAPVVAKKTLFRRKFKSF